MDGFFPKTAKSNILLTIFYLCLGALFIYVAILSEGHAGAMTFGVICIILTVVYGRHAYKVWSEEKELKEEEAIRKAIKEQQARKEAERKQAQEKMCASGEWHFPVDELYRVCCEAGAADINNEFGLQKAMLLAASILRKNNIPERYHSLYLDDEKVRQYFLSGKARADALAAKKQAELELKMRVPQKVIPTGEEWVQIRDTAALLKMYGTEKRIGMLQQERDVLSTLVQKLSKEIDKKDKQRKEATVAAMKLGSLLTEASTESKNSWGLAGGIAQGLAGPSAGLAAASEIMWDNAQSELRNQQIRKAGAERTAKWLQSISEECSTYELEKAKENAEVQIAELDREIERIREKVVLNNVDNTALTEQVITKRTHIRCLDSKVLEIGIRVTNNYVPDVPPGVSTVVDGVVTVDVYHGETYVGTAHALLPLYGLESGKTTTVVALCPYYLEGSPDYRTDIRFSSLWVMEQ